MKILTVVGARPQFIKSAPVSQALLQAGLEEVVVHTGQHYDVSMSAIFFDELGLKPPLQNLEIGSGPHGQQTGRMLEALERVMIEQRPAWALVYGDTNSTLAGALAAAKLHIPVAHVEAGLRSFNRRMPEEINRVLADHVSSLLFAPTDTAVANLQREGIANTKIAQVGDVMFDTALMFGARAEQRSEILKRLGLNPKSYVLATIHRAENTEDLNRLTAITEGLIALSRQIRLILPIHPRTKKMMTPQALAALREADAIVDPVGYLDMVMLEKNATLIVTDSGGVQKEAFFYRVPCVTLRDETEWAELVELGWNTVIPPRSGELICEGAMRRIGTRGVEAEPFGPKGAAPRIAKILMAIAGG